jgi:hypothetical protein
MCKDKSHVRENISRGGQSTGPRRHKKYQQIFCVTLDMAAAASSADKAVNFDELVIEP